MYPCTMDRPSLPAATVEGVVRACRHPNPRVAESALAAVRGIAAEQAGRGALVDAGAIGVLQLLMGHKNPAVARLAATASQSLFVKQAPLKH